MQISLRFVSPSFSISIRDHPVHFDVRTGRSVGGDAFFRAGRRLYELSEGFGAPYQVMAGVTKRAALR